MENNIKNFLENKFHVVFLVKKISDTPEEYEIRPQDDSKEGFKVTVIIKEDIRITIIGEPDVFGRSFVDNINTSSKEKRNVFIEYWNMLGQDLIELKINDRTYTQNEFIDDSSKWYKFYLKFSKVAYYDSGNENKIDSALNYIFYIFAMIFSITSYEIIGIVGKSEGSEYEEVTKKHERNPINRELCLKVKGYICSVCGFKFEDKYGEIGKNFIEVHHSVPVSQMGEDHVVDPIKELFPLCSNCHSMIHRKNPPFTIEELKNIINKEC